MADAPQWGTLTIEVPDFLESTRDAINSVAEFLVTMLDIVLAALQLVKAFLTAFIDPILSLIQKIIDELNALIQDIRQMGIYITGDWKLFDYPFDDLRGGYNEYERRMAVRLTDRTDPTRPNLSGRTKVFGLFFYLSVDISDIQRLVAFVMRLIGFFKQDWSANTLPSVHITDVRYGLDTVNIMNPVSLGDAFTQMAQSGISGDVPNIAQVRFKTHTPNKNSPFNPFPANMLGPDGFVITVSTYPDGIQVKYDKPRLNTTTEPNIKDSSKQVQPRDYGAVRGTDGKPVVLYGGQGMMELPASLGYNHGTKNGGPVTGSTRIYGYSNPADNAPIPLDDMGSYFQKTFWMDQTDVAFQSFTGEYVFNMKLAEMPLVGDIKVKSDGKVEILPLVATAEHAGTVHVRIAAVNKAALEKFKYNFGDSKVTTMAAAPGYVVVPPKTGCGDVSDIGQWSRPQRVTFPNANTAAYLQAVQSALVVLFLCRPDLVTMEELKQLLTPQQITKIERGFLLIEGTAALPCGLESLKQLLRVMYDGVYGPSHQWKRNDSLPLDFRLSLDRRVRKFTQDLYARTGPMPDIEGFVAESTEKLRSVKWGEIIGASNWFSSDSVFTDDFKEATLLEALNTDNKAGSDVTSGLAVNPWSIGINADEALIASELVTGRTPQMFESTTGDSDIVIKPIVPLADLPEYLATIPAIFKSTYEASPVVEGVVTVSDGNLRTMNLMVLGTKEGSGDHSPVVFTDVPGINQVITGSAGLNVEAASNIVFARTLLTEYEGGQLIREAKIALGLAGNLWKRNDDEAWIAIRFLDVLPGIDDFLETISNWVQAIKDAIQSIVDTIIKYIEWLEARIIEIQQLIRRINALIQSLLGHLFQVPACSALMCISNGTDGVLSDLMNSQYKPNDGPLAYGAGIALVVPFLPSFVYDLLLMLFKKSDGSPSAGSLAGEDPPDGIPLEGLPGVPAESQDAPPDVL